MHRNKKKELLSNRASELIALDDCNKETNGSKLRTQKINSKIKELRLEHTKRILTRDTTKKKKKKCKLNAK